MTAPKSPVRRGCPHCKAPLPAAPTPRCPKCKKPILKADAATRLRGKGRPAPAPPKSNKKLLVIGGGVGALLLVAGVVAALTLGGDPPAKPPPPKPDPKEISSTGPDVPDEPVKPPPPQTFKDRLSEAEKRVDRMLNAGKSADVDYVAAAEMMEALRAEAAKVDLDQRISDWISTIKDQAAGVIDERFASVREEVFKLLQGPDLPAARAALAAWEFPPNLNVQGLCEEIRGRVGAVIGQFDEIDRRRDEVLSAETPPEDVRAPFAEFIDSEIEVVAAHGRRTFEAVEASTRLAQTLASLKKELDDRREAALARVEHARGYLDEQRRLEEARIAGWRQRMADGTAKSPFKVKEIDRHAPPSIADKNAVVKDVAPGRLVFGGDWGTHTPALADIPAAAYAKLAKWALDGAPAKDCYEFGVMCVRGGAYAAAEDCFKQAVAADAAYAAVVPDVAKIRRGLASFSGDLSLTGGTFKLEHAFDAVADGQDFEAQGATLSLEVDGGRLKIEGGPQALAVLRQRVRFHGRFAVTAKPVKVENGAAMLGILIIPDNGDSDLIEAWADDKTVKVKRGRDAAKKDVGEKPRKAGAELKFEWDGKTLKLLQGAEEVWSDAVADIGEVQPYLGVGAEKSGKAEFDAASLVGPMEAGVIRKFNAERALVLEAELAKIERLVETDPTAFSSLPRLLPFPENLGDWRKHPLEEKIEGELPPDVFIELRDVHRLIRDATDEELRTAEEALGRVIAMAPKLPLGHYYRAAVRNLRGDREGALADLDGAAKAYPYFMEAQVARATIHTERREYAKAQEALDQAIEAVPDMPDIYMQRALMYYYSDEADKASADLEMAVQLDPANAGNRSRARGMRNVIRGPHWKNEAIRVETPHYLILREPPPAGGDRAAVEARMREWAAHLEAARPWFGEVMGRDPGKDPRTPRVYIFETAEGYHTFAEFTMDDRIESSVGVFHRLYKQLMFYDGYDPRETIETMVHEGFHQFLDGLASGAPTWFNEGTAEYVSGIEVAGGKIAKKGLLLKGRLRDLQGRMRDGQAPVPFEQILREPQWMFYSFMPSFKYAQAWSMVHFFMEGGNAGYKKCYQQYASLLLDGKSSGDAYRETFEKMDLKAMLEDWKDYAMKLKL